MCADFRHLADEVQALDQAGADIFHCDIMDGTFVPNFTMGVMDVKAVRQVTDKLVDCHLMIDDPADKVDWFIDAGADIVYIHPESERFVVRTLAHIRDRGAKAGLAIDPDTPVSQVTEMLNLCDYVMVMTVNPGFAGQKFIPFTRAKVEQLATMKEAYGFKLMVDGACSPEVIRDLSAIGADGFVLGTSALFGKGRPYQELIADLRK